MAYCAGDSTRRRRSASMCATLSSYLSVVRGMTTSPLLLGVTVYSYVTLFVLLIIVCLCVSACFLKLLMCFLWCETNARILS